MDKDVDLGFHVDDAEVTLNVCLGDQFSGGDLFFRGVRCEKHVNTETQPEVELMEPAVKGTLNVLKACSEAKVPRVVFVSSLSAVIWNPSWPAGNVKDENCWSDKEYCKRINKWYCASKTEAEMEASEYARRSGLDLISVCPGLVLGPMLQSTVNTSSAILINYVQQEGCESTENKLRMIVDARDLAAALLMVFEKPEAEGRYICTAHDIRVRELVEKLRSI